METLLRKNILWWTDSLGKESCHSGYTLDCIKKENPMFDFSLLAQINHKVCTTESQEQQVISCNDVVDYNSQFISFICDVWNYDKNQFRNKRIISTLQRPYLETVTTRDVGKKIFERFQKDRYIAVSEFNESCFRSNHTMLQLLKKDNRQFKTKNKIILTYHELNDAVTNKDNISTKWLTPTTFKLNKHWQNFSYALAATIGHHEEYKNCNKKDLCILFFVGICPNININHLFYKLRAAMGHKSNVKC